MPIITKPSEALSLALKVMQSPESPWASYNLGRGSHRFTCNALEYLEEAEEITEEAMTQALDALYPLSQHCRAYTTRRDKTTWFWEGGGYSAQERREAAIKQAIRNLEKEGK